MKITKTQLRRIIREEMSRFRPQKKRSYHQVSDSTKAMANAVKRKFLKLYDAEVEIDDREGWITVNGKKAVNISSASGRPMSMEDMISQMLDAMWGNQ
jgi:histone H3/H4